MERIGKEAVLYNRYIYYILRIFFIGYYIVYYIYILLERWVAGTPAHGRDRGRASGRGRLSHAGTTRWPSSPQQPRWQCDNLLRQMVTEAGEPSDGGAGPLHQARDLCLRFFWRETTLHRQTFDEFPELSTGTRLSLLQLSEPILTLQLGASLDRMFQQKIQTLFVGTPDISHFLGDGTIKYAVENTAT